MQIATQQGYAATPQATREASAASRPSRSFTKRLEAFMDKQEMGIERVSRVRKLVIADSGKVHSADHILACPEQFKSRTIRALIHVSKHVDELAESFTDISGLAERLARNMISAGEKSDLALVVASAAGRIISGQLYMLGFALHKAVGAGLYCVSSLASLTAIGLAYTRMGARRTPEETRQAVAHSAFDHSAYRLVASKLLCIKECLLNKIMKGSSRLPGPTAKAIQQWVRFMSRERRLHRPQDVWQRKTHCNYMWQNLHQYGPLTRALMHTAYGVFQGVNKLLVSFDRHLAVAISNFFLKKKTGEILGCRLALTVTVAAATALSIPMAPLVIGLSTAGAIACGVALSALLLAKLNVHMTGDWQGNISKPIRHRNSRFRF